MTIGIMPGHNEEETQDEIKVFKTEGGDGEPATSSHNLASDILAEDRNEIVKQVEIEGNKAPWAQIKKPSATPAQKRPSPTGGTGLNGNLGGKGPPSGGGSGTAFKAPVKSSQGPAAGATDSAAPLNGFGAASASNASLPHTSPFFVSGASNGLPGAIPYSFLPMWPHGQGYSFPSAAPGSPLNLFFNRIPTTPVSGASPAHGGAPLSIDPTKMGLSPSFSVSPHFPYAAVSPSFDFHNAMALSALQSRFSPGMPSLLQGAPSPATNLSPLHSPQGTPIVPTLQPKGSSNPFGSGGPNALSSMDMTALLKQQMAAVSGTNVNLPPSGPFRPLIFNPAAFSQGNHLQALNQIRLPHVTTTPTSLAASLAAAGPNHNLHRNGPRSEAERRQGTGGREEKREPHVKKPLNAFMIFMKENRAKLMEEKGYKERQSAELNKELGRLWHTLSQEEQQKYYQMARDEKHRHMQLFPTWTARDNYAVHKKKKRKRDKNSADEGMEMKKCRARFGLDKMSEWCKHCKRKKKCLWFREGGTSSNNLPGSSEQSPIQVSSTTQGSPTEGPAGLTNPGSVGEGEERGEPPAKIPRNQSSASTSSSASESVSSPSAVSSSTTLKGGSGPGKSQVPKVPGIGMVPNGRDPEGQEDEDDDIVSEDGAPSDESDDDTYVSESEIPPPPSKSSLRTKDPSETNLNIDPGTKNPAVPVPPIGVS